MKTKTTLIFILYSILFLPIVHANVGDLDVTFGDHGFTIQNFSPIVDGNTSFNNSTLDNSGKIIIAGYSDVADFTINLLCARFNTNGTLDTTFSNDGVTDGYIFLDFGIGTQSDARDLTIDDEGHVIIVGTLYNSYGDYFIVTRLNSDGSLDTTFSNDGATDGYTILDFDSSDSIPHSIALDSTGKIIISGYSYNATSHSNFAVARLNSDGTLDNTFSDDGYTILDFGFNLEDEAHAMTLDDSDKIILAGHAYNNTNSNKNFAVARLNSDGTLDNTFSDDGYTTLDIGFDLAERSFAVTTNNSNKIIIAGFAQNPSYDDLAIVRFNDNGTLDHTFNNYGYKIFHIGTESEANAITIDSLGKILVEATINESGDHNVALTRFNNDGTLDTTFTSDGFQSYSPTTNGQETFESLNIDKNGNYILVGNNETDGLIAHVSGDLCGNNNLADGEECDDNNNINGDGCSEFCQKEVLWYPDSDGDGLGDADNAGTSSAEAPSTGYVTNNTDCDDTNKTLTTDCSITTVTQTCLNKEIEGTEECDDGKATETCSADCKKISLEKSSTPSTSSCSLTKTNTPSNILFECVALQIILFGWMRKSVTQDKKNH